MTALQGQWLHHPLILLLKMSIMSLFLPACPLRKLSAMNPFLPTHPPKMPSMSLCPYLRSRPLKDQGTKSRHPLLLLYHHENSPEISHRFYPPKRPGMRSRLHLYPLKRLDMWPCLHLYPPKRLGTWPRLLLKRLCSMLLLLLLSPLENLCSLIRISMM